MGMFEMSEEVTAEYRRNLIAEARTKVSEPVVAAAVFRRGGAAAKMGVSKAGLGAVSYAATALFHKKRAGGLPDKTLFVATPTKLHAYKAKIKGAGAKAGEEIAVWDRAALRVSSEPSMGLTMLTIELPAEGEKVTMAPVGVRDDPVSLEMIRVLSEGITEPAPAA